MRRIISMILGFGVLFFGTSRVDAALIFGSNLIVNPGAEAGAASPTGFTLVPIPGWNTLGTNLTVVRYSTTSAAGDFPSVTDPGPPNRGTTLLPGPNFNFFAGGPNNANSSAIQQLLDFSTDGAIIDAGLVTYDLSGWFGGFNIQNDNAKLTASFLDSAQVPISSADIGQVLAVDRGDQTGLLFRSTNGTLPINTRYVLVKLDMQRTGGAYNDGYADDLSLVMSSPVPEPTTLAMWGLGVVGLARFSRRFRRSGKSAS